MVTWRCQLGGKATKSSSAFFITNNMETDINEIKQIQKGIAPSQTNELSVKSKEWLATMSEVIGSIVLIASIISAIAFGVSEESWTIFWGILFGGFIEFLFLQTMAVLVKAANKYLDN